MVAFVIQVNTPPDPSTEQVKVASSPGQMYSLSGDTEPLAKPTQEAKIHSSCLHTVKLS